MTVKELYNELDNVIKLGRGGNEVIIECGEIECLRENGIREVYTDA